MDGPRAAAILSHEGTVAGWQGRVPPPGSLVGGPQGPPWICGTNPWSWLPPGWLGRWALGFPWAPGESLPRGSSSRQGPSAEGQMDTLRLGWHGRPAAACAPSLGLQTM